MSNWRSPAWLRAQRLCVTTWRAAFQAGDLSRADFNQAEGAHALPGPAAEAEAGEVQARYRLESLTGQEVLAVAAESEPAPE